MVNKNFCFYFLNKKKSQTNLKNKKIENTTTYYLNQKIKDIKKIKKFCIGQKAKKIQNAINTININKFYIGLNINNTFCANSKIENINKAILFSIN